MYLDIPLFLYCCLLIIYLKQISFYAWNGKSPVKFHSSGSLVYLIFLSVEATLSHIKRSINNEQDLLALYPNSWSYFRSFHVIQ